MEKVRKKSFYILASNLLGFPVQLLRSIILANVLGPTGFGILSFSLFFSDLSKYADFGFVSVAERRYSKQNIGYDKKILKFFKVSLLHCLSSFIGAIILIAGFIIFGEDKQILLSIIIATLVYPVLSISKVIIVFHSINFRFWALNFSFLFVPILTLMYLFSNLSSDVSSYLLALLFSNIVFMAFLVFSIRDILFNVLISFLYTLRASAIKRYFFFGIKFSGLTILAGVGVFSLRWLTENKFGWEGLGNMALALTIVTAISSSMRQATLPFIVLIRQNINKLYEKKLKLLVYPVIVRVFLSFVIVLIFYSSLPFLPFLRFVREFMSRSSRFCNSNISSLSF